MKLRLEKILNEGERFPERRWSRRVVTWGCLLWSLFQLVIVRIPVNDTIIRSIHLAFAMGLAFWIFPRKRRMSSDQVSSRVPYIDMLLSVLGALGALYLFLDFEGIASRPGLPLPRDLWIGGFTLLLLLEAARRSLGPALAVIGLVFALYCFFGQELPDLLAHRGASIRKFISHMYLSTEGIYGVPLRVSASFVFLFVLFGSLLEKAGAGKFFIDLSYALLGRFRGGPGKAAVAASGLTGMISGSSIANTVTTGTFTIPLMKKIGLSAEKAAAIEVAASTNGQLMPPIMGAAAFIIAEFLGIAYFDVVRAAFIPAVTSYIGLFLVVHLEASKIGLKGVPKEELPSAIQTFFSGFHFLLPVFVLLYSLIFERQSPSLAAFYGITSIMVIMLVQGLVESRQGKCPAWIGLERILSGMVAGAKGMIPIGIATAAAGLVVGAITLTGLGQRLLELIEYYSMGYFVLVLLLTALTSLILGMGLPTTANYIVMASLTAPVIIQLGVSSNLLIPAIAAHLFVFYFGILADDTPPVGLAAYAASAIAGSNPIKTGIQSFVYDLRTAILPFMFIFNTDLLLIQGVRVGASPSDPSSWIWITSIPLILFIFLKANLAMAAFIVGTMGYAIRRINLLERALFFVAAFLIFRPSLVPSYFGMGKEVGLIVPSTLLALLMGWQLLRRKKPNPIH